MAYAVENALFQWLEGERRVRETGGLDRPVERVLDELRRRLGGVFTVEELAGFYSAGTEWADPLAGSQDAVHVVDAAFGRYAREAANYAGGVSRPRTPPAPRPDE